MGIGAILTGAAAGIGLAIASRLARCRGNIVNIASWNWKLGAPNFGAYSGTKAAAISLTQALAREVASQGIRVNAVCPGIVAGTPMRRKVERQGRAFGLPPSAERAKTVPLGRLAVPEDIAARWPSWPPMRPPT